MSTIASPRASISVRSPSSTRTSLESARPPQTARRNRAALRDYYGLKNAPKEGDVKISEESTRTELAPDDDEETLTELDAADFHADAYVESLLAKEGLKGVLKVEADLISQIRNLDSDRKSLVYDNYSKLLSATSTIRRMRGNMDPLAPTTHTLGPAISHIAETAASLSASMQGAQTETANPGISVQVQDDPAADAAIQQKLRQANTVKWVLGTPQRLQDLIDQEQDDAADKEWAEISKILDIWKDVPGVAQLREECESIMQDVDESD